MKESTRIQVRLLRDMKAKGGISLSGVFSWERIGREILEAYHRLPENGPLPDTIISR